MIAVPPTAEPTEKAAIRSHYDLATPFYRLVWGPHIHHGLWSEDDAAREVPAATPRAAQEALTDTLAALAAVEGGGRVLDVGCGMGGSSIRLARRRGCHVTGITLSGVQRRWAATVARLQGVGGLTTFLQADAETVDFPRGAFDVVWSIECTEHLFDKPAFFRRAADWLAPGGRMALCAWLAAEDAERPEKRGQVESVCDAFLCPSLGSFGDYRRWLTLAGLEVVREDDWTRRVERTWEVCAARVRRLGLHGLARLVDRRQARFAEHFTTLLDAYRSGAMQYGCIVARLA
ncbi:MAG: methyltransferase domain-containing protein [Planctomycetia bacterium]|nr:methyltransferase domain-containing protein [Planctomycetia bacterium]